MKKYRIAGCVCIILGMVLIGCGGSSGSSAPSGSSGSQAAAQKFQYKMGSNTAEGQVITVTLQWVIDELKAKTNGNFSVDFFPNNLLGAEMECRDMASEGTLELVNLGFGILANWEPAVDLQNFLYTYRSTDELYYITAESAFSKKYFQDNILAKANIRMIAQWANAPRQVLSRKPVKTLNDLQKLKMRIGAGNLVYERSWRGLGALVVQIPLGDTFTALQQGTVDALEMPIDFMYNYQFQEVCKHLTNTNHARYTQSTLINENAWKKLPVEYQNLLVQLMEEGRKKVDAGTAQAVARIEKDMKEKHGVQIYELDSKTLAEFEVITQKVRQENAGTMYDQARYDDLQAALNEYRNKK